MGVVSSLTSVFSSALTGKRLFGFVFVVILCLCLHSIGVTRVFVSNVIRTTTDVSKPSWSSLDVGSGIENETTLERNQSVILGVSPMDEKAEETTKTLAPLNSGGADTRAFSIQQTDSFLSTENKPTPGMKYNTVDSATTNTTVVVAATLPTTPATTTMMTTGAGAMELPPQDVVATGTSSVAHPSTTTTATTLTSSVELPPRDSPAASDSVTTSLTTLPYSPAVNSAFTDDLATATNTSASMEFPLQALSAANSSVAFNASSVANSSVTFNVSPMANSSVAFNVSSVANSSVALNVSATNVSARENDLSRSNPIWDTILTNSTRIVSMQGRKETSALCFNLFGGKICRAILGDNTADVHPHLLVNVSFNCLDLYAHAELGTGNFMSAFYALRMIAHTLGNVDVLLECDDAYQERGALILPWMMGFYPKKIQTIPAAQRQQPTLGMACADYKSVQIGHMAKEMRFDLRRMAIALVGIPSPDHPAAIFAEQELWSPSSPTSSLSATAATTNASAADVDPPIMQLVHPQRGEPPIYPNVDLDEAVLHFRCGDLIASNHPSFGFMKFDSFARHLDPDVKTIGIATQPFDSGTQKRAADGGSFKQERCRLVVNTFVDHLQAKFPNATITIRNDRNETIALTFARMVMAKQVVVAITSFGVFPGLATFGRGYIRKPDYIKAPNRWLLAPNIETVFDNVKLIEEPRLMAINCKNSWGRDGKAVLNWFTNYTLKVPSV